MQILTYLHFNGDCEEAFRFYERCLGGTIETMQSHGDTPNAEEVPAEWHDRILHARLAVEDQVLMGSDTPPGHPQEPGGFSVSLSVDEPAEADRLFKALSEKGSVAMPIQETFWAARFGMLVDQFGVPWMVSCDHAP